MRSYLPYCHKQDHQHKRAYYASEWEDNHQLATHYIGLKRPTRTPKGRERWVHQWTQSRFRSSLVPPARTHPSIANGSASSRSRPNSIMNNQQGADCVLSPEPLQLMGFISFGHVFEGYQAKCLLKTLVTELQALVRLVACTQDLECKRRFCQDILSRHENEIHRWILPLTSGSSLVKTKTVLISSMQGR